MVSSTQQLDKFAKTLPMLAVLECIRLTSLMLFELQYSTIAKTFYFQDPMVLLRAHSVTPPYLDRSY
jgi:hypothetical protein